MGRLPTTATVLIIIICAGAGWSLAHIGGATARRVPRGHLVPVVPGGTALRLAMVHDVLTERYPRHGAAWHEARVTKRRAEVDRQRAAQAPSAWSAAADLAVSLDLLQRSLEAEPVLREQIAALSAPVEPDPAIIGMLFDERLGGALLAQPLAEADRPRYAAYANLATILAHAHAKTALAGDPAALPALREARTWVHRALTINPGAHFGRELWQVCALNWLISVAEHPERLTTHDLLGRSWATATRRIPPQSVEPHGTWRSIPRYRNGDLDPIKEAALDHKQRQSARGGIPRIAIEEGDDPSAPPTGAAFDRPVLGLLGMWMHGGGPSPHLALALGHILESVEQRWLAWEAYARALSLAARFPERGRATFVAHCAARQQALVAQLEPGDPSGLQQRLEVGFAADLAAGIAWQRGWQEDESVRLAAGADVDDPALQTALRAAHPVPATPPDEADHRWVEPHGGKLIQIMAGLLGLLVGLVIAHLWNSGAKVRAARAPGA